MPKAEREGLRRAARALKKTQSEYVRDLIARDLDSRAVGERIGHLIGILDSAEAAGKPHPLRDKIRERNWRK